MIPQLEVKYHSLTRIRIFTENISCFLCKSPIFPIFPPACPCSTVECNRDLRLLLRLIHYRSIAIDLAGIAWSHFFRRVIEYQAKIGQADMRIEKQQVVTSPAADTTVPKYAASPAGSLDGPSPGGRTRWLSLLLSPLWLCLLAALIIRVWLAVRTHGTLDGDEALLGIQAEHILQGERPIYFYGIPYFGSLEAYVAALLFALFGPSVAALRAETTAFSLLLVCVTWWLAGLLAKAARLSPSARTCFTLVAALVAALPPLYDGIVELRTGGGWIESFVVMLLLMVAVQRLTTRWHEKAAYRELALRWAGVGFLVGFGMWIYPLVSVAIMAAALWIIIDRLAELVALVRKI